LNWVDYLIIISWSVSLFLGWRIGLYGAVFTAGGLALGVVAASTLADKVAEIVIEIGILDLSTDPSSTVAIGVVYCGIILAALLTSQILRMVIRGLMKMVLLGWVDRVGGLALGLFIGTLMSIAVVGGLARVAGELTPEGLRGVLQIDEISSAQGRLYSDLAESTLTPVLLDIQEMVPGSAFGLIPEDLEHDLEILRNSLGGDTSVE
jgi:uncharacterized membrane protein required for colicin V production